MVRAGRRLISRLSLVGPCSTLLVGLECFVPGPRSRLLKSWHETESAENYPSHGRVSADTRMAQEVAGGGQPDTGAALEPAGRRSRGARWPLPGSSEARCKESPGCGTACPQEAGRPLLCEARGSPERGSSLNPAPAA